MKHIFNKTAIGILGLGALILSDAQYNFEAPFRSVSNIYRENREMLKAPSMEEIYSSTELKREAELVKTVAEVPKLETAKKKARKKMLAKDVTKGKKKIVRIVMGSSADNRMEKALAHIGELTLQKADDAKPFAEACSGFIQRDGNYGKIGKELVKNMQRTPYKSRYLKSKSLSQVCPNYRNLKAQQKLQAWVWFWMVLSNEESSCQVETPHGTHAKVAGRWIRINPLEGYGLFAAELYGGDRQWRGDMCRGNMKTMKVQVSCAIHTMYDRHLAEGEGAYTKGSYWGPVRRKDKQIVPNMGLYKPCFDGGSYAAK